MSFAKSKKIKVESLKNKTLMDPVHTLEIKKEKPRNKK
jgi:hypothetical protein